MQITVSLKLIVSSLEIINFFRHGLTTPSGAQHPHYRGFRSHSGTPHLSGLLWTSDQPEAETST